MIKYSRDKNDSSLVGKISVPSDKSICHRAILFSSIAEGSSEVTVFEPGRDNLASIRVMQNLGVEIDAAFSSKVFAMAEEEGLKNISESESEISTINIVGAGLRGLKQAKNELYCGNSGTTARLLCGILSGQKFSSTLTGDVSLSKRPFKRVSAPLSQMGASFSSELLPLTIHGAGLKGLVYESPVASAQVKSAILLAGLYSEHEVSVIEPRVSRDHTERMFSAMGVDLEEAATADGRWQITLPALAKRGKLSACNTCVPADFSAAAFFMVAASLVPGSSVVIENVGFNKTRTGLFLVLKRMGAKIEVLNERVVSGEEVADLKISYAKLLATTLSEEDVLLAIDEIPIFCIAAAFASGTSSFRGAKELRVKESDRLSMMTELLRAYEIEVREHEDGLDIVGNPDLEKKSFPEIDSPVWQHCGDHRIVMSSAVFSYVLKSTFVIEDESEIETSFPNFTQCFQVLQRQAKTLA